MENIILVLEPLTCPSCMQKIEGGVSKISGVEKVKVLFNASKVKATIDSTKTNADALKEQVEKLGFTVKKVKVKES